jgi:hypothetical protein
MVGVCAAQIQEISGERIRAHVKFLASDELEGRGVGTRGDRLTTEYLAAFASFLTADSHVFRVCGVKPRGHSSAGVSAVPGSTSSSEPASGEAGRHAEAIFVGHGITA